MATELRDGDYVYRQGDDASEFFVILDGQVQKVVESGDGSKVCLLSCLPAPCPCGFLSVSLCACMPGTQSSPDVMRCEGMRDVMKCDVMKCDVICCHVMSCNVI